MRSSKYFYYLFLINAMVNIINFVPRILQDARYHGALLSILIAVIIGPILMIGFVATIRKFPGQGIPQIFNSCMPKIMAGILLIGYASIWYMAGGISLLSYLDVTIRFISPDISPLLLMIGFLLLVTVCSRLRSDSILYGLEVILIIFSPIILYMLGKCVFDPNFNWDAVKEVLTHLWIMPNYTTVAAASYIFSGYLNLAVFNTAFKQINMKRVWLIPVIGLLVLFITFVVPIGYHGTVGVERYAYHWFSVADSIRIELFVIERMLFLFYVVYLTLAMVSSIIHWHVALELCKGALRPYSDNHDWPKADWWILAIFSAGVIMTMQMSDQTRLFLTGEWFLNIRLAGELTILGFLLFASWRRVRRT